jgi:hypothetical protein
MPKGKQKWTTTSTAQRCLWLGDEVVRLVIFTGLGYNVYATDKGSAEMLYPLVSSWKEAQKKAEKSLQ